MLESFFNTAAGLKISNFSKIETQTQLFPVNIAKSLRTVFYAKPPEAASIKLTEPILRLYGINLYLMQDHGNFL